MPSTPLNRCAIAGGLSGRALTRLEIVDSGAGRPVLRIEVLSTSSRTGVAHEYGFCQPAASAHDREPAPAKAGDMNARKLCAGTQRGHIRSCKQFAAFLKRSPDTATAEDIRLFQLHLAETGM